MRNAFTISLSLLCLAGCDPDTDLGLARLQLLTLEQVEQCLKEAGVDKNRRPLVRYLEPGQYETWYQVDGGTMYVDCTHLFKQEV